MQTPPQEVCQARSRKAAIAWRERRDLIKLDMAAWIIDGVVFFQHAVFFLVSVLVAGGRACHMGSCVFPFALYIPVCLV